MLGPKTINNQYGLRETSRNLVVPLLIFICKLVSELTIFGETERDFSGNDPVCQQENLILD